MRLECSFELRFVVHFEVRLADRLEHRLADRSEVRLEVRSPRHSFVDCSCRGSFALELVHSEDRSFLSSFVRFEVWLEVRLEVRLLARVEVSQFVHSNVGSFVCLDFYSLSNSTRSSLQHLFACCFVECWCIAVGPHMIWGSTGVA